MQHRRPQAVVLNSFQDRFLGHVALQFKIRQALANGQRDLFRIHRNVDIPTLAAIQYRRNPAGFPQASAISSAFFGTKFYVQGRHSINSRTMNPADKS